MAGKCDEDFFERFKSQPLSKTKRFDFKKVVKTTEITGNSSDDYFEVRSTGSEPPRTIEEELGNSQKENDNKSNLQGRLSKAQPKIKPKAVQSKLSFGVNSKKSKSPEKPKSPPEKSPPDSKRAHKSREPEVVILDDSPVVGDVGKVKKFTFKKSAISLPTSVMVGTPTHKKTLDRPQFGTNCTTLKSPNGSQFSTNPTSSKSPNGMEVTGSLDISGGDYMDDSEFERRFLSQANNETTSVDVTKAIIDDFDLNSIDWGDDDLVVPGTSKPEETPIFNGSIGRSDNSSEFRGQYEHTRLLLDDLHDKFGLRHFRPHQEEIINASLLGHDCFVLMPTGGGKSLCYQLPASIVPGVTIVISPLRALISDQVDKLNTLNIPSAHLCADVKKDEVDTIYTKLNLREPPIKLLYLTPEKIVASGKILDTIRSLYNRDKLVRFVIDEAHCLSQWGHDFRPDYKQLSCLRRQFSKVPIICLTATATKQVQNDVVSILNLRNVKTFIRSFNRPNIKYKVVSKTGKKTLDEIGALIKQKFFKKSGIIYCLGRNDCEKVAQDLTKSGIKSKAYHAGMSDVAREKTQREWMQDQFHVIVATIAFGMGIDKPDVRFVIHNSIPKSVEAFYQESGRGGRDGDLSYSYLFYSYGDVGRLKRIMQLDRTNKKALEGHYESLNQMVSYCENTVDCRRYLQLIHLGEKFDRANCVKNKTAICDNCDNMDAYQFRDVTQDARDLCQLVRDIAEKENVTMLLIVEVYKGSAAKKIMDKGYNKHRHYAKGSAFDRHDIQRILVHLVCKHYLTDFCTFNGEFPVVYIKPGMKFSQLGSTDLKISIPVSTKSKKAVASVNTNATTSKLAKPLEDRPSSPSSASSGGDQTTKLSAADSHKARLLKVHCHEELIEECRRLAVERNGTLSSIMNLSALKTMSEVLPADRESFMKIQHVTNANFEKFGEFFLKITKKYRADFDKLTPPVRFEKAGSLFGAGSSNGDDDWFGGDDFSYTSPNSASTSFRGRGGGGVKRKSRGGFKKGTKRFKKTYNKKGKGKSAKTQKSSGKKSAGGGGLGLMPLRK